MAISRKQARGFASVTKLRRKLRQMPDVVEKHIRPKLEKTAANMAADLRGLTPVDHGTAAHSIDYKMGRDGLTAQIGITGRGVRDAFYWKFLDGGTKGFKEKNIPAMPALHMRQQTLDAEIPQARKDIAEGIAKALDEVARG